MKVRFVLIHKKVKAFIQQEKKRGVGGKILSNMILISLLTNQSQVVLRG